MKAKVLILILLLIFIMVGIVHDRVVASRDKGLATDWNADHTITGNVDMDQYSWENQVIENLNAFPGGPVEGQIIWRSDLNKLYIFDGAEWIGPQGGTLYWSCSGVGFTTWQPDVSDITYDLNGRLLLNAATILVFAPVNLPDGATVTKAIVYGNAAAEIAWNLVRQTPATAAVAGMATANVNTEDVTINHAVIDNSLYSYYFQSGFHVINARIYGARIEYIL